VFLIATTIMPIPRMVLCAEPTPSMLTQIEFASSPGKSQVTLVVTATEKSQSLSLGERESCRWP
jgi:hypothetical protein